MAYDSSLAGRVRAALAGRPGVVEKSMFGGLGFLLDGNLCVGVRKETLLVRTDPARSEVLLRKPHVEPFGINGRTMKGWLLVALPGVQEDARLNEWIQEAWYYVKTLPPK